MDFLVLLELILALLKNCPQDDARVFEIAKRGGFLAALPIRRQFRQAGLRGSELRAAVQAALDALAAATDDDIRAAIEDAKEV